MPQKFKLVKQGRRRLPKRDKVCETPISEYHRDYDDEEEILDESRLASLGIFKPWMRLKISTKVVKLPGEYPHNSELVYNVNGLNYNDWITYMEFDQPGQISAYIDYLIKNIEPYFQTMDAYKKHMMILLWCRQHHQTFRRIDKHILKVLIGWPSFTSKYLRQHTFQSAYEILYQRYLVLAGDMFTRVTGSTGVVMAEKMWNLRVVKRIQANQKLLDFM